MQTMTMQLRAWLIVAGHASGIVADVESHLRTGGGQ